MELHRIFYECMGSHDDLDGAVVERTQDLRALLAFHNACEQFHTDRHIAQEVANGLQVLLGENLRGSHHASLVAVVECDEHRHQGHKCLSRPHIALQQTVHLSTGAHVGPYLMHHPLLGSRELEGQVVVVEGVEDVAHFREHIATILTSLVAGIAKDVQLHIE